MSLGSTKITLVLILLLIEFQLLYEFVNLFQNYRENIGGNKEDFSCET